MRITEVVKGDASLNASVVELESAIERSEDAVFWLVGFGKSNVQWAPPTRISAEAVSYLQGLSKVPVKGPRRLEHFLDFLQHSDQFVVADAYNEFAEASSEDIAAIKNKLDRRWVIAQLRDKSAPTHRRRLCWTFLSQCGTAADASLFDEAIRKRDVDPGFEPSMDAAIACFITLGGEQALARIERDYLASPGANYADSYAAINAIRVHGTDLNVMPRARLATALRLVLNRPALADLVIPDLARWKDWSAIDRIVELFELPTQETGVLKPVAVRYLKTCPLPAASKALDRLRTIDPSAVQLAESSMMFHSGLATIPVPPPDDTLPNTGESNLPSVAEKMDDSRDANEFSTRK
ncbi:hypothetical protein [Planctomycetes bacterium K23_9]